MFEETYGIQRMEPVKRAGRQGAGRRKEANPLEDAVKSIVGQVQEDGRPVTFGATFQLLTERGETLEQRKSRIRRFLTRAGKELAEVAGVAPYNIGLSILQNGQVVNTKTDGGRGGETSGEFVAAFWDRNADKPAEPEQPIAVPGAAL